MITVITTQVDTPDFEPVKGARKGEYCYVCAAEVWVAPSTDLISGDKQYLCTLCAPGVAATVEDFELMPPTPEQWAELREHHG